MHENLQFKAASHVQDKFVCKKIQPTAHSKSATKL